MTPRSAPQFDILARIDEERRKRGWSEYQLAQNSELPQSTISTWHRKGLSPSVASIEMICSGLGISLSEFFAQEEVKKDTESSEEELHDLWKRMTPKQKEDLLQMIRSFLE